MSWAQHCVEGVAKGCHRKERWSTAQANKTVSSTLVALLGLSNSPGQKQREPELSKLLVKIPNRMCS